jgi:hypothetical protein
MVITTHHQVLSVINHIARRFVGEGISASAEEVATFEYHNRQAAFRKFDSGAESGKAAADDEEGEKGRRGDGAMGRWGDGAMGRWGELNSCGSRSVFL